MTIPNRLHPAGVLNQGEKWPGFYKRMRAERADEYEAAMVSSGASWVPWL